MFRALLPAISLLLLTVSGAAQTDLNLTVKCVFADGADAPVGLRILRSPVELDVLPTAAWIEKTPVQRGKWRPWSEGAKSMEILLHPTPEVTDYSWRVVVYRKNSMLAFRMASESYREFAVGVSEPFAIDPAGGAMEIKVPVQALLKVQPKFGTAPPTADSHFRYTFSYGPMGRPPRYAHGDWDGQGFLPIDLSPLAFNRPGTLTMELQQLPCALPLGPAEFQLQSGTTTVELGALPEVGSLNVQIPDGGVWQIAVGYVSPDDELDIQKIGTTDDRGNLIVDRLREGKYHLMAVPDESSPLRPGIKSAHLFLDFDGGGGANAPSNLDSSTTTASLESNLLLSHFDLSFGNDLKDYQITVRCMWGPFLVDEQTISPAASQNCQLPTGPQFKYQAIAQRWNAEADASEVRLFLDCKAQGQQLQFSSHATMMEVDGYEDGAEYTLRLLRGEQGPVFPPLQWQITPLTIYGLPYLPLPFTSMIQIHGLPEGAYEASLWGWDRSEEEIAELSYHYPVAD